jgi:hypothetical protein
LDDRKYPRQSQSQYLSQCTREKIEAQLSLTDMLKRKLVLLSSPRLQQCQNLEATAEAPTGTVKSPQAAGQRAMEHRIRHVQMSQFA